MIARMDIDEQRLQKGKQFLEHIWWMLAKRIVRIAGDHYTWTEEEWRDAIELFLRPGDYTVVTQ